MIDFSTEIAFRLVSNARLRLAISPSPSFLSLITSALGGRGRTRQGEERMSIFSLIPPERRDFSKE